MFALAPPKLTVRTPVVGRALTSGLMLDDPVARKVIHGYQSGGIVVHPVAGACVGIINERDVQRSFEVGRCMLTRG